MNSGVFDSGAGDARSRRQSLVVSNWSGSAWTNVAAQTRRFVHDDWNLLAALDGSNALVHSFVWGSDLSGSIQDAGGVGGLLAVNDAANGVHFAAYDANGNVMALVKGTDGTLSANYEYGPFGETVRATGQMAKVNPLRFSTKYQDAETDFLYYGYRSYNPSLGRWLSRDPIGELGFETLRSNRSRRTCSKEGNLYGFVGNNPVTKFDLLGLSEKDVTTILDQFRKTMKELCDKGRRCDCVVGPAKDVHAFFTPVWGCGRQADAMNGAAIALLLDLDDEWVTEARQYPELWPIFWHQDVLIQPKDPSGEVSSGVVNIVLDTFKGCYTVTRRKPRIIFGETGVPVGAYWLYSYETKCYTCDDFKKTEPASEKKP